MTISDIRGHLLTGATARSLPHYETATRQLNLFVGDPVASVDAAIAESPDFVMAHALRAYLHLPRHRAGRDPGRVRGFRTREPHRGKRKGGRTPHRH